MSSTWALTYVNKANSGTQDGHSWQTAWRSIQDGVDQAYAGGGGEVWVAAGTYTATTNPVVTMKDGVHIYGGFFGTEISKDQRSWNANIATVDGENARRCVIGANNALLDGFTITKGFATGTSSTYRGGGMYNSGTSATVTHCTFTSNTAGSGGGIYMVTGTVVACTFTHNSAFHGAGMEISGASVRNCIFMSNSTPSGNSGGAGICMQQSSSVDNCIFIDNTANGDSGQGGGLSNGGTTSSSTVTNCTFWGNHAGGGGAGIYNSASLLTIKNCIFWLNYSPVGPKQIFSTNANWISVIYSCVQGGYSGTGNINADPLHANPPSDVRLQSGSPCINVGTATGAPAADIEGIPRPQGAGYDMGAYEYYVVATTPNVVGMTQSSAQTAIASAGLVLGTVDYAHSDTVPGGHVISQSPAASQQVPSDTAVNLVVSEPIAGTIVINSNRSATNSQLVTLALTWAGGAGAGVTRMRFSDDGAHWTSWEGLAATCSHTLPSGDGHKTVRVQYRDSLGGTSAALSDYILLDTTPPTGSIIINGGAANTVNRSVTLGLTWADGTGAGVSRLRFSDDGAHWTVWETPKATRAYTLPAGLGYHTVRVQYLDGANNYSAVYTDYIKLVSP
jgi:predicted outer membrane repeat protein